MKFLLHGREIANIPILGAVCGLGCDAIQLDVRDVLSLARESETESGQKRLADWWMNAISCRFVAYPTSKVAKAQDSE
jgi:hypothetical protein